MRAASIRAAWTDSAVSQASPAPVSVFVRKRRLAAWPSTTSTEQPCNAAGNALAGGGPDKGMGCTGIVKANTEPRPGSLSTRISPPMRAQSRWQMARPRPVPPYLRVVEESTCENNLNSSFLFSCGMPMPVSRTAISMRQGSARAVAGPAAGVGTVPEPWCGPGGGISAGDTSTETQPRGVNFTALFRRLTMIWRSRVTSPTIQAGTPGSVK